MQGRIKMSVRDEGAMQEIGVHVRAWKKHHIDIILSANLPPVNKNVTQTIEMSTDEAEALANMLLREVAHMRS
jgi:acyl-CoA hydrolase